MTRRLALRLCLALALAAMAAAPAAAITCEQCTLASSCTRPCQVCVEEHEEGCWHYVWSDCGDWGTCEGMSGAASSPAGPVLPDFLQSLAREQVPVSAGPAPAAR
jgi:hypothetical protein